MEQHKITVSIGGGREIERAGLAALIAGLPGLRVIPLDSNPAAQVLVWVSLEGGDKLPTVALETAILLLTDDDEFESLPKKVTGLMSRDESSATLGIAIRQVARGEQYLSAHLVTAILQKHQQKRHPTEAIDSLTARERDILDLLVQGLSNKMIATRLYLSVRTVEGHLAKIYSRLGVHSRTEAILIAVNIPKSIGT